MLRQRINQSESRSQQRPSNSSYSTDSKKKMDTKYSKKSRFNLCYLVISFFCLVFFIAYIVVPIVFKLTPSVRRHLLFMNYVNFQMNMNLSNPESEYKLKCTHTFHVDSGDGLSLGVWHVLPGSLVDKYCPTGSGSVDLRNVDPSQLFNDDKPIFLYSHGNGGTRGGNHRLGLYKLLAYGPLDAHVITYDYRGYGDSSSVDPSVPGLVDDAFHMYQWLSSKVNHSRINVWGHSLGTAVSVALVKRISNSSPPNSLTLEAPFNDIVEAISEYPLAIIYKIYPLFDYFFIEPFRQPEFQLFNSQVNIKEIKVPTLILHAKDDAIVPFKLGFRLYKSALEASNNQPDYLKPVMIIYREDHGLGHKNIYKEPTLTKVIGKFISHLEIEQTFI
ncbi:lysophosphatidylserine lipase ABHD12-like [Panonychus citri]|uniref:lysophosphatidylserine lipase ABHD12-like n=1 Tax=Panonychus citri TaxID=50023 RepID=UPI002306FF5E|nr:lysophosphatidylserine lipase ABHD12-like [Panonychus citri]